MASKNLNIVIASSLIGTTGISYQSFPAHLSLSKDWTSANDENWWNKNVPAEYALSEIQVAEINNIRTWNNEKIISIQKQLYKLRMGFEGFRKYTTVDKKTLRSYKVKIWNLEDKILDINKETGLQIKNILTAKQLDFFNSGGYDWWSIVDNNWSSGKDKTLVTNQKMKMSDRGFSW